MDYIDLQNVHIDKRFVQVGGIAGYNNQYICNGILVDKWQFTGGRTTHIPDFRYINFPINNKIQYGAPEEEQCNPSDVTHVQFSIGQNNSITPPLFNNHQFALINGIYYDPLYGTITDDSDHGLSGYYYFEDTYFPDKSKRTAYFFKEHKNNWLKNKGGYIEYLNW